MVFAFKEITDYLKISEMNMRMITANVDSLCTNQCYRFMNLGSLTRANLGRPNTVITNTKMGPTLGQVHISSNRR